MLFRSRRHAAAAAQIRGPQPPKAPTFDGKADWRPFFMQFQRTASRYEWGEDIKLDRLVESLKDKALAYYSTLTEATRENFDRLTTKLNSRFGMIDPPIVCRRKLQSLKQLENETLEELAERCQRLVLDGYGEADEHFMENIAVNAFLKAVSNKDAAYMVMARRDGVDLQRALTLVKLNVCNQEILYGTTKNKIRQLGKDDQEEHMVQATYVTNRDTRPKVSWADQLEGHLKKFDKALQDNQAIMKSMVESNQKFMTSLLRQNSTKGGTLQSPPPSPRKQFDLSSVRCHGCGEMGHMIKDCGKRDRTPPSSPQSKSSN